MRQAAFIIPPAKTFSVDGSDKKLLKYLRETAELKKEEPLV